MAHLTTFPKGSIMDYNSLKKPRLKKFEKEKKEYQKAIIL